MLPAQIKFLFINFSPCVFVSLFGRGIQQRIGTKSSREVGKSGANKNGCYI